MARILLISNHADAASLLLRIKQEGHSAGMFIRDKHTRETGVYKGLGIDLLPNLDHLRSWAPDLIFFDMVDKKSFENKWEPLSEKLRKAGFKVIGAGAINDKIELDRDYGSKVFEKCGLLTPPSTEYHDFNSAIKYAEEYDGKLVAKFAGNQSCASTYVAKSPQDMVNFLRHCQEKKLADASPGLQLQEVIEGVLVSTEGVMNSKGRFIEKAFSHTMEEKKFMPGGWGEAVGCMGNIVWFPQERNKLMAETVLKMEEYLGRHKYIGWFDLNVIVEEKAPHRVYVLECTARTGFSAEFNKPDLLEQPYGEFLLGARSGMEATETRSVDGFAIEASIPPYPQCHPDLLKKIRGVPIRGPIDDHTWLNDARKDPDGGEYPVCAGLSGSLFTLTTTGQTPDQCWTTAKAHLDQFEIENLQIREDCHARVDGDVRKLSDWGLL